MLGIDPLRQVQQEARNDNLPFYEGAGAVTSSYLKLSTHPPPRSRRCNTPALPRRWIPPCKRPVEKRLNSRFNKSSPRWSLFKTINLEEHFSTGRELPLPAPDAVQHTSRPRGRAKCSGGQDLCVSVLRIQRAAPSEQTNTIAHQEDSYLVEAFAGKTQMERGPPIPLLHRQSLKRLPRLGAVNALRQDEVEAFIRNMMSSYNTIFRVKVTETSHTYERAP